MKVLFDNGRKIYHIKLVYVGAPESGKTTNVVEISKKFAMKAFVVNGKEEKTIFCDFTVPKVFEKGDTVLKITTYSVPGQERFRPMREMILNAADVLVFVADSSPEKMHDNKRALRDIEDIVERYYKKKLMKDVFMVFQYNKRDSIGSMPIRVLSSELNHRGSPEFEAVAQKSLGVVETFVEAVNMVLSSMLVPSYLSAMDFNGNPPSEKPEKTNGASTFFPARR